MPVEVVEGWPEPQPMCRAPRNGTRILVAFRAPHRKPGYPPWLAIARWVEPVQREGQGIPKKARYLFERYGGYWVTGYKVERPCGCPPLGWWELPRFDGDEPVQ